MTAKNLRKRKVLYMSWCFLCKDTGEDMDRILLHCKLARRLWDAKIREEIDVSWKRGARRKKAQGVECYSSSSKHLERV